MLRTLALASLTIAVSAIPMLAQDHRDGQFYRDDNAYSRENIQYRQYGQYGNRGYGGNSVFDRVRSDLTRASRSYRLNGHERDHVNGAFSDLDRFQSRWQQGSWDGRSLDKAIEHVAHLADANRVDPRDRDMLRSDLQMLRDFRANRGQY